MPSTSQLVAAFSAVYVVWGSTYLAIRVAIGTIPPFLMAGTRFLCAGSILYVWARQRGASRPERNEWRSAAIVGALLLLLGNGGLTWSEQLVPSGLAALLVATVPMWIVLLDWLLHGASRPRPGVIAGLAIGLIGMVLLIGPDQLLGRNHINLGGVGILMVSTVSWAAGSLFARTAKLPSSPLLGTSMEMLAGGISLIAVAGVTGEFKALDLGSVSSSSLLALAYLILFGSIIAFSSYVWLLRVVHASRIATYAYVNPVIAIFLGWLFAGEQFSLNMLFAACVIIIGVVLIVTNQSEPFRKPIVPAAPFEGSSEVTSNKVGGGKAGS